MSGLQVFFLSFFIYFEFLLAVCCHAALIELGAFH